MWKFEFQMENGKRCHRYFSSCHTSYGANLWYYEDLKRWVNQEIENPAGTYSNHSCEIRTLKAFKRHLRKHKILRQCEKVTLCSRYRGYDITAKWEEEVKK